jgi:hypothetical protein
MATADERQYFADERQYFLGAVREPPLQKSKKIAISNVILSEAKKLSVSSVVFIFLLYCGFIRDIRQHM